MINTFVILLCAALLLAAGCGDAKPPTAPATRPTSATQPDNDVQRIHVFVSGHVQGVGFRAFTQEQAEHLKLTGWVRNLPDGRVEAIIQGPPPLLKDMIDRLRLGPGGSRVDEVRVTDEKPEGTFTGFKVVQ